MCEAVKPLSEFYPKPTGRYGVASSCRLCQRAKATSWYRSNIERDKARCLAYREKNRETLRLYAVEWRKANPEKRRQIAKNWEKSNPDAVKAIAARKKEKLKSTLNGRLRISIGTTIRHAIRGKKKGRPTFEVLGYSVEDLKRHLESKFLPGMSWDNYGPRGWHIDHIVPLSAFNFECVDHIDFKRAWALSNLQPLWAEDNERKGNRLSAPFQPSLAI